MPLNEVGDFLAGVFGPLALFWLILGFLQQGKELQQNTQALELQAEELRNSVQQQKELVKVSKKQVDADLEASKYEKIRLMKAAQPNFVFQGVGGRHSPQKHTFIANIKNTGNTATHVTFSMDTKMNRISPVEVPSWEKNLELRLEFEYETILPAKEAVLTINYTDYNGTTGVSHFNLFGKNNGGASPSIKVFPV